VLQCNEEREHVVGQRCHAGGDLGEGEQVSGREGGDRVEDHWAQVEEQDEVEEVHEEGEGGLKGERGGVSGGTQAQWGMCEQTGRSLDWRAVYAFCAGRSARRAHELRALICSCGASLANSAL